MKKVALVFVVAVIAPSLVLAWLAVRSLRDQELVVERQQTLLYQGVADNVAHEVARLVAAFHTDFNSEVETLVQKESPLDVANRFDERLRPVWSPAEVGFAVSLDGQMLSPSLFGSPLARKFRLDNERFLCSRESVEVYWNTPKGLISQAKLDGGKDARLSKEQTQPDAKTVPMAKAKLPRTVMPEKDTDAEASESKLIAEQAEFQSIVGDAMEGTLARFLQDKLKLLFWYRSKLDPQLVYGAQVNLARLIESLKKAVEVEPPLQGEICAALLDDTGKPVALSQQGFKPRPPASLPRSDTRPKSARPNLQHNLISTLVTGDVVRSTPADIRAGWKRPFVATEIGEVLPHWEVAVYLVNPSQIGRNAGVASLAVGLLIGLLVLAITVGSWLIVSDLRRQLTLARQKTDFVSNVSHELKTPLTSIRMFSEMLADDRVQDAGKRRQFLNIITAETARLTRLINNVLDFARMERGEKKYDFTDCDLAVLARDTIEAYRPHLEAHGFALKARLPTSPVFVRGDRDALGQIIVNLLSNAEKYCGERKEIEVVVESKDDSAELRVLDRGPGVPHGCEERIFEQFYRAHDSLASGIQGSGLGLTLARQIARAHGGDVTYAPRVNGGSCFTLRLPVENVENVTTVRRAPN